jgi:PAS domain S-box-containing protein
VEEITITNIVEDTERLDTNQELILGLTLNEEIIQFNKEMECLTGYQRDEVLHKKLENILLPTDSISLWKKLLESIRQNMWIDEFVLPIKTKQNQMYKITWTGFFIKDEHGSFKDICLIGTPLKTEAIKEQSSDIPVVVSEKPLESKIQSSVPEPMLKSRSSVMPTSSDIPVAVSEKPLESKIQSSVPEPMLKSKNREIPMMHGLNKIIFANEKKAEVQHVNITVQKHLIKPREAKGKKDEKTSDKPNPLNKSFESRTGRYDSVIKRLGELETKNQRLGKSEKNLGEYTRHQKRGDRPSEKKQKETTLKSISSCQQPTEKEEVSFFSDPFGFKRQHRELDERKQQLDIRSKELEALQSHLQKEQNSLNIRIEELSKWREKLELLESAIEKRRQELMKQEDMYLEKSISFKAQRTVPTEQEIPKSTTPVVPKYDETLDKIPHSAAIIQRGILKQINNLFLQLLGYTMEETLEKSFFDFIALEGLADVEQYYLDRLKGDNVSVYKTIFTTKDSHKISAEVNIKQTIFNGEKAEIAIITCLEANRS